MYQIIKDLCKEKDISVYRLEKDLGLSTGSVSKWSESIPRADTLLKISNHFNVSVEYLLGHKEDKLNDQQRDKKKSNGRGQTNE